MQNMSRRTGNQEYSEATEEQAYKEPLLQGESSTFIFTFSLA